MRTSRIGLLAVALAPLLLPLVPGCGEDARWQATVASVEVVRPVVEVNDTDGRRPIGTQERLAAGAQVQVGQRAQALLRHDGGARLILDGEALAVMTEQGVQLTRGRLWADARPGSALTIAIGNVILSAGGDGAGFEALAADRTAVTVVRGEVAWRATSPGAERGVVHAGEVATLATGAPPKVAPVVLWDDWTGGLAWPDSRKGGGAPGMGEVGARRPGDLGEARFPLSVQRLQVRARIEDDLAVTTVEQTFFNPAESTLEGIYRVRIPEGAILSRFAIDRRGRFVDGYVKERATAQKEYQEKVYEGSTHDPALLEWEAPGVYKARLYPLPPGSTRRVLITYGEWLPTHGKDGTLRTYRYPMAASARGGPIIQELDIEVDAERAGATGLRAGLGAILPKSERRVVLQRTDYLPTADLVVELLGGRRSPEVARGYRAPHEVPVRPGASSGRAQKEDEYVLLRAQPVPAVPATTREPVDVVLVVDLSAATDATHLAMARTFAESVLRHLTPEDRVTLLGADLDLHPVVVPTSPAGGKQGKRTGGKEEVPPLQPATPEQIDRLLAGLGRAGTGGATDLGSSLSQAAALLQPDRLGAVIYVGDAQPTVGELDLPALRERLERLPAPLRLYGIGIGAEADLGLLEGLCEASAGQAFRVSDRAQAAETALLLTTHLSHPAATRVMVDAGPGVDRVYPRQAVSVLAGEPLFVVARLRKEMPKTLLVSGLLSGKPFQRTFKVEDHRVADTADLRLRWSLSRLRQLLQSGASTEEVAELGVRQDLITPFTSFYVPSEEEVGQMEQQLPDVRAAGCAKYDMERHQAERVSEEPSAYQRQASHAASAPAAAPSIVSVPMQAAQPAKSEPADRTRTAMAADDAPAAAAPPEADKRKGVADAVQRAGALGNLAASQDVLAGLAGKDSALGSASGEALNGLIGDAGGGGGTGGESTIGLGILGAAGGGKHYKGGKLRGRGAPAPDIIPGTAEVRGSLDKELIRRIIRRHLNEVKFCYEKELTRNRGLQGRVLVQFTIGTTGAVTASIVQSSTLGNPVVEQCIASAVHRWEFPKPQGGIVIVTYPFVLRSSGSEGGTSSGPEPLQGRTVAVVTPPTEDGSSPVTLLIGILTHRPRGCSAASTQPLDERIELWRERLSRGGGVRLAQEVFQDAEQGCELSRWTDRRELLRLMLRSCQQHGGPAAMVQLYQHFDESPEAQEFLRRAILGEVRTPADLRVVYDGLGLGDEEKTTLVQEVVHGAKTLSDRLDRIHALLLKWPGNLWLKLQRMEAEEMLGEKEAARRSAEEVRSDAYADAQARTAVGELYLRLGDEQAARRAFSEIVEFAPRDPLARRRLGDLYRAHGWYDEAYRQYQTLLALTPSDLSVLILQALGAFGAGHIEESLGLLSRVTGTAEPGSETGLSRVALLWSDVRLLLLRDEARKKNDAEELARLLLRARRTGVPSLWRPVRVVLTWAHPEADLELHVAAPGEAMGSATELAPQFGLLAWQSERDSAPGATYEIEVRRGGGASSALQHDAELLVVTGEGEKTERLVRVPLRIGADRPVLHFTLRDNQVEVR